jgi:hypothetical protein
VRAFGLGGAARANAVCLTVDLEGAVVFASCGGEWPTGAALFEEIPSEIRRRCSRISARRWAPACFEHFLCVSIPAIRGAELLLLLLIYLDSFSRENA